MGIVHLLRYGETGRSVEIVTPLPQASATWEVHDLTSSIGAADYVVASGAATVDTLARSPSADAGPHTANPRRLSFVDTSSIAVGRVYLLEEAGRSELVEVAGLSANAYVDLRHPLVGSYTEASSLQGLTLAALLPDAIAATRRYVDYEEPLRIVWTLASGERRQQQIRVVRQDHGDFDKAWVCSRIRRLFPNVGTALPRDATDALGDLVDTIHEMLSASILAEGEAPERVLHGDQGGWVLVWATLLHLAEQGAGPGSEQADLDRWVRRCSGEYEKFYGKTRVGLAGHRTAKIEPISEATAGDDDRTVRSPIRFW